MAERIDATFLAVQSALVGEYSLERELGRGGMGVVYLAREVALDRLVAIKVLPPQLAENGDLRTRFLRESQTAARLSHPNIVPIFRVGESGDFVYFAMAYVEGETLTQRVRARGPLAPPEGMRILREAAWALAYAHARGIVHRDVKPDNIMLESGSGRAMLTDFGIAHVAESAASSATEVGLILGTAHYMSPEQAAGDRLDGRSDLYALGLVAHFVFAGQVPFDAPSVAAILAKQLAQPAPQLSSVAPGVPRKAGEAIDRCLAKLPDERFATGEALAEALTAAVEPSNEIPAPIRVWIAKGERGRGASIFFSLYLSGGVFVPLMVASTPWFALGPFALIAGVVGLPLVFRTRRVLRAGYTLNDLRGGLRAHWIRRREELAYEQIETSKVARYALWTVAGAGWATMIGALVVGGGASSAEGIAALGGMVGGATSLLGVIDIIKRRFVGRAGSMVLRAWNSRWADRLVKLARTGLKNIAIAPAAPQLTEVALGRATDALFQALPAPVRRDLRELPGTVRALEADAQKLRGQIEQLERSLAELGAAGGRAASRTLSDSVQQGRSVGDERHRVIAELTATRDLAKGRLAASVAALENIRLGLMRLQLGGAPVASVTTAIEAAQRLGEDVARAVAADSEVSDLLKRRP